MIGTAYFAWLGTIYLLILTYKDFKHNMNVDDRPNWFMMGVAVSLYSHFNYAIWWILCIVVVILALRFVLMRYKPLGEADINSIGWIMMGFTILNIYSMVVFFVILICLTVIYAILRKLLQIHQATPYYIVLVASFLLNCLLFSYYTRV